MLLLYFNHSFLSVANLTVAQVISTDVSGACASVSSKGVVIARANWHPYGLQFLVTGKRVDVGKSDDDFEIMDAPTTD